MSGASARQAARFAVSKALTAGALVRQPCERCGKTTRAEAHHEDYAAPLTVTWLCHLHHVARHQERIASGLDPKPVHGDRTTKPRPHDQINGMMCPHGIDIGDFCAACDVKERGRRPRLRRGSHERH